MAPRVLKPSNATFASRGGRVLAGSTDSVGVVQPDPEQAGRVERRHRPALDCGRALRTTFAATQRPLVRWRVSKSTVAPTTPVVESHRSTKRSLPPSSGLMKPLFLLALTHVTVPVSVAPPLCAGAITVTPAGGCGSGRGRSS